MIFVLTYPAVSFQIVQIGSYLSKHNVAGLNLCSSCSLYTCSIHPSIRTAQAHAPEPRAHDPFPYTMDQSGEYQKHVCKSLLWRTMSGLETATRHRTKLHRLDHWQVVVHSAQQHLRVDELFSAETSWLFNCFRLVYEIHSRTLDARRSRNAIRSCLQKALYI